MSAYVKIDRPSVRLVTPAQKAEVVRRAALGQFGNQIACAVGISAFSVRRIARAAGVTLTRISRQEQGRRYVVVAKQAMVDGPAKEISEWRARAYSSRRFGGSGYVT